jgi:hypothetical protein
MSKPARTTLVVTLLLAFVSSAATLGEQDPKARIKAAAGILVGPPNAATTQAALLGSLLDLLDVTVVLTRQSQYASEIKSRIDIAKELFQNTSLFNDKARQ